MYELKLEGMTCDHCVHTVEKAILSVDKSSHAKVDLKTQTAQIETDQNIQSITQSIEDEGYSVVSVQKI